MRKTRQNCKESGELDKEKTKKTPNKQTYRPTDKQLRQEERETGKRQKEIQIIFKILLEFVSAIKLK